MPETISSLMGSSFSPAQGKKLRKVGDHWEDDQGNKFSDEGGTQPLSETAQAKQGAPALSAMDANEVEKSTGTGGWAPQSSAMATGGESYRKKTEGEMRKEAPAAEDNPNPDVSGAEEAWKYMTAASPTNIEMWGSKQKFIDSWKKMTDKERKFYRAPAGG